MAKRMEIRLNFEKKHLFVLIILVVFGSLAFVVAQSNNEDSLANIGVWSSSEHTTWHDAKDIKVKFGGKSYSLQDLINVGAFGGGNSIINTIGNVIETIRIPEASEDNYDKVCTRQEKLEYGDVPEATTIREFISNTREIRDINSFAFFEDKIVINDLELESGGEYSFSCSYDGEPAKEVFVKLNNQNYSLIAAVEEKHISKITLGFNQYDGLDLFGFYVKVDGDNKLDLLVENENEGGCSIKDNIIRCEPSNRCPIYEAKKIIGTETIYPWKSLTCRVSEL